MQELLIFQTNNSIQIDVNFDGDTVWLTQKQMSILFDKNIMTINEHIKNIYEKKNCLKIQL